MRPLRSLLLFPYVRDDGAMRLLREDELRRLPATHGYLCEHEEELRGRERGRMDRDGWWAYVDPKSLGLHERPMLGVAATVRRLEVALDLEGEAYFHNVRVNGILPAPDAPPLPALLAVLNSRPVDFAFRRGAAPLQNGFFGANKQFVAWLPVPHPLPPELDRLGSRLHALARAEEDERGCFLDWLGSVTAADVRELPGFSRMAEYVDRGTEELLRRLDAVARRLGADPSRRALREQIRSEAEASAAKIVELRAERAGLEQDADHLLLDAYGLSAAQRARIDAEY